MVIKLYFTPEEIRRFFMSNGYNVVTADFGNWCPSYHNQSEWMKYTADGIIANDRVYEASKLFESVIESNLKRLVAPTSGIDIITIINNEINKVK